MLLAPALGVGVVVMTNREEEALWPAMRVLAVLLGQPLPRPALDAPTGLFVEDSGPFWAELSPGAISVMGGYEQLVAAARPVCAACRPISTSISRVEARTSWRGRSVACRARSGGLLRRRRSIPG